MKESKILISILRNQTLFLKSNNILMIIKIFTLKELKQFKNIVKTKEKVISKYSLIIVIENLINLFLTKFKFICLMAHFMVVILNLKSQIFKFSKFIKEVISFI
jgi:hypothetical protein